MPSRASAATAEAQAAGRYDAEIVAMDTVKAGDRQGERRRHRAGGPRSRRMNATARTTTLDGLQSLQPVRGEGKVVTAGNASQAPPPSSDGASATDRHVRRRRPRGASCPPLGIFRGMAVAGCAAEEMGIGPVLRHPAPAGAPRAQRPRTSTCGKSTRPSPPSFSIAVTRSASIPKKTQRQWRRHLHRPPLRHERRPQWPAHVLIEGRRRGRQARRRLDVRRRRHGGRQDCSRSVGEARVIRPRCLVAKSCPVRAIPNPPSFRPPGRDPATARPRRERLCCVQGLGRAGCQPFCWHEGG